MSSQDVPTVGAVSGAGWRAVLLREARPLLLAALVVGVPLEVARLRYGSFENLQAVLNGEVLLVDARTKSFGELGPDDKATVRFELWNTSDRPVRILGGLADCGCAWDKRAFPQTVPASGRVVVSIAVRPPDFGEFEGTAYLYTSAPGARELTLRLTGARLPPSPRAA